MFNMGKFMKQAQQMQERLAEVQEELEKTEVEGAAGGGLVRAVVNGQSMLRRVTIDPSLCVADEVEVLEDMIVAAFNEARSKAEDLAASKMSSITGGMNLPGGMKLPF